MRNKKQAFNDNLNFYHTFLQFNPPYPILMDGSFILSIIANRVDDIGDYLKEHFGSTFNFFTTKCVQYELDCKFPNDYQINAIMEKVQIYECSSRPHSCINSVCTSVAEIGEKNLLKREHGPPKRHQYVRSPDPRFIIAMQNASIMETLREVAGVPLMYFEDGHLYLERPSKETLNWVSTIQFRNMELLELQREILQRAIDADDIIPRKDNTKEVETEEYAPKKRNKGNESSCSQRISPAAKGNASCEETKKSRRDLSPDICDLPGPSKRIRPQPRTEGVKSKRMEKFEVYRTLFWDCNQATSSNPQGRGGSRRKVRNFSYVDPTDLITDTSTFEFGNEDENQGEVNPNP